MLPLSITAFVLAVSIATTCGASKVVWKDNFVQDYYEWLFSNLVVRGIVMYVEERLVPLPELVEDCDPRLSGYFGKVTDVTMRVDEVLRGVYSERELTFVVEAAVYMPPCKPGTTQAVVGLRQSEHFMNGRYQMQSNEGLYLYNGELWESHGEVKGGRTHTIDEIRSIIQTTTPEYLCQHADVIVTATVNSLSAETELWSERGELALVRQVRFEVNSVLKGSAPQELAIDMITRGLYWPSWRTVVPSKINPGETWYLILQRLGEGYTLMGGLNGFLRIDGDRLVYDNRRATTYTKSELDVLARSVDRSGDEPRGENH
jgi:hypothetical protein